jgi:hypothetical protein
MPQRPSSPDRVQAARRAVRITVAAVVGFYPAVYALDEPVVALYAPLRVDLRALGDGTSPSPPTGS